MRDRRRLTRQPMDVVYRAPGGAVRGLLRRQLGLAACLISIRVVGLVRGLVRSPVRPLRAQSFRAGWRVGGREGGSWWGCPAALPGTCRTGRPPAPSFVLSPLDVYCFFAHLLPILLGASV